MDKLEEAILTTNVDLVIKIVAELKEKEKDVATMGRYDRFMKKPVNSYTKMTALHVGCVVADQEIVELILGENPDLLAMDVKNRVPLHCAIESRSLPIVKLLTSKLDEKDWTSKSLTIRDSRELTCLHLACGSPAILELLLAYSRGPEQLASCKGLFRRTVMSINSFECLKLLGDKMGKFEPSVLNEQDDLGKTALILAVEKGCLDTSKLLIEFGVDPAICDVEEQNALHWACFLGHEDLKEYLLQIDKDGTLATKKDIVGRVPLDWVEDDTQEDVVAPPPPMPAVDCIQAGNTTAKALGATPPVAPPPAQTYSIDRVRIDEGTAAGRKLSWRAQEQALSQMAMDYSILGGSDDEIDEASEANDTEATALPKTIDETSVKTAESASTTAKDAAKGTAWREDRDNLEALMSQDTDELQNLHDAYA